MNIEEYLVMLQLPYEFLNFREERETALGMTFDEINKEAQDAE